MMKQKSLIIMIMLLITSCAHVKPEKVKNPVLRSQELFQSGNYDHAKAHALLPLAKDFTVINIPSFRLIIVPRRTFLCDNQVSIGCYGRYMLFGKSSPVEHNITMVGTMVDGKIYTNPAAVGHELEHLIGEVSEEFIDPHNKYGYEKSFYPIR